MLEAKNGGLGLYGFTGGGAKRPQTLGTPRSFFEALHREYAFTLDGAASSENALLPRFSASDAPVPWKGERVFCNPPWASIRPFVEQAVEAEIAVLLVPARVNSAWFHRALALGARVRYFLGRLHFRTNVSSPFDCLLLVFEGKVDT